MWFTKQILRSRKKNMEAFDIDTFIKRHDDEE